MSTIKLSRHHDNQHKQSFIQRLLDRGVYKLKDKQLYECTIEELEYLMRQVDLN
ncbi:MAG: Fur-regulated basic protein FbpA [Anaerobacillus sp.]